MSAAPARAGPAGWHFVVGLFAVATLLQIAAYGQLEAFTPLFLERALALPSEQVPFWTGLLAAIPLAVAAPLSPFWGVLADRYSAKPVVLRSLLAAALAYGLAALAGDIWQLLAMRLLLGLTFGNVAIVVAVLTGLVPDRRLGLAIGIVQMMLPVGRSVGPILGSGLIGLVGLRGMFAVDALLTLGAFLLVLALFREPPRSVQSDASILERLRFVLGVTWRTPPIRQAFALFALAAGVNALVVPFLPIRIAQLYAGPDLAFVIGLVQAGYGAMAGLSAPLAGRLSDRLGPTRLVALTAAGLAMATVGLLLARTPLELGLVVLLGGVPFGAINTALYTHLARCTPRQHLSAVMSLTPLARNSAMLVGPLVGAAVVGYGLGAVFAAAGATAGLAFATSLSLARTMKGELAQGDTEGR